MSLNEANRKELESLLSRYENGGLDDQTMQRLAELLKEQPDAIDIYLDHFEMDAMLRETLGLLNLSHVPAVPSPHRRPVRNKSLWILSIVSVCLLAIGVGAWRLQSTGQQIAQQIPPLDPSPLIDEPLIVTPSPTLGAVVATVARNTGADLLLEDGSVLPATAGIALRAGRYELNAGVLELSYESGASVIVQSPAVLELRSKSLIYLVQGRVSTRCPTEQSKGFSLETPSGVAVDLGTEFSVEVSPDRRGKDEYHVFSGEIIVNLKSNAGPGQVSLTKGQATRTDHRTSTPAGIDVDYQRFIRSFDSASTGYYEQILELDPVVYYVMRIEEGGRTLRNEMGEYADAAIFFSAPGSLCWAPGFNGGTAFNMDGMQSETYAVAPDYPKSLDDQLSVVAWVYAESRPWWGSIAKNWQHGLAPEKRGQFHFGLFELEGVLEAHINDNDNVEQFAQESVPLPLNRWHHVAMVADGNVLRLYRGGKEVAATPYNGLNGNPEIKPLAIGNKLGDDNKLARPDSGFWDGCIDHLAIFNKALTPDQIQELYEVGSLSEEDGTAHP